MRIWHGTGACVTFRLPLVRTGRTLGQFPFVTEQIPEEVVAPLSRRAGPDNFQAAGNRVISFACAKFALPAEALFLDGSGFRLSTDMLRVACAVSFSEGVAARDECNSLLVVHCHAREDFADILGSGKRIWVAVRAFRINID